jgi:hypothetical protein
MRRTQPLIVTSLLLAAAPANAEAPIAVNGSVDAYVSVNPNRGADSSAPNDLHAFDLYANDLSFSYAEVVLERAPEPVGFRLDLGFGPTTDVVNATSAALGEGYDLMRNVQQAYAVWKASPRVTLKFGKMVTPFGLEVIETQGNWNYTHGLLFSWALPFTHTGLHATVSPIAELDVSLFVVNGLNNTLDGNEFKSPGLQVVGRPAPTLTLVASYMAFNEQPGQLGELGDFGDAVQLFDVIAVWNAAPILDLALELTAGLDGSLDEDATFAAAALYGRVRTSEHTHAALRGELFADSASPTLGILGVDGDVVEATATFSYAPAKGLLLRVEGRVDQGLAGFAPFTDADGNPVETQVTTTFGAVAAF